MPVLDQMRAEELPLVLDWAAEEGWNPGVDDAGAFFATDPGGFFVARNGTDPVAAISVVNHSDSFAFLGLYICHPGWRGQGIGFALWQHALAHAGSRTIGLDGVLEQQANYETSSFKHHGETIRFTGEIDPEQAGLDVPTPDQIAALTELDAVANGYEKPAFLGAWLTPAATRKTLILEEGTGFATVRQCKSGAKLGPLVTKTIQDAEKLLHCAASIFDGPLTIDVPGSQKSLAHYCRTLGMISSFSTARMYRGPAPKTGNLIHATATLELG